jgi:hypothetical protein
MEVIPKEIVKKFESLGFGEQKSGVGEGWRKVLPYFYYYCHCFMTYDTYNFENCILNTKSYNWTLNRTPILNKECTETWGPFFIDWMHVLPQNMFKL